MIFSKLESIRKQSIVTIN